ncbi:hypothetical protein TNIN_281621 [Trichonephila inaurata madagascariensis]|uniref:Uncharacterized protein n=1 Tax=Trichonephila inaurata madagascariensis TaxID=2747483 RepID=A0A8X6YKD1_9ARAC|nr:hypothetical protein TNIN_281621 [Trichonephila inaurata madagascariensis]
MLNIPRKYLRADLDVSPIHSRFRQLATSFYQNTPNHCNNSISIKASSITPGHHRDRLYRPQKYFLDVYTSLALDSPA